MFKKSAAERLEAFTKNQTEDYRLYREAQKKCTVLQEEVKALAINGEPTEKAIRELDKQKKIISDYATKISALANAKSQLIIAAKEEQDEKDRLLQAEIDKKLAAISDKILELQSKISELRMESQTIAQGAPKLNFASESMHNVSVEELEEKLLSIAVAVDPVTIPDLIDKLLKKAEEELPRFNYDRIRYGAPSQTLSGFTILCRHDGSVKTITPVFGY